MSHGRTKSPFQYPNLFLWLPFIGLLLIGVLIAVGVLQQSQQNKRNPDPDLGLKPPPRSTTLRVVSHADPDIERRHTLLTEYLRGADQLLREVGDPRISELITFLDTKAGVTVPVEKGLRVVSGYPIDDGLPIVLLSQADARYPQWKEFLRKTSGGLASYAPIELKGIVLRIDEPYTVRWGALVLLHEASHALRHRTQPFDVTNLDLKVADEIRVHKEANAWVVKLGGPRYEKVLMLEMERQADDLKRKGKAVGDVLPEIGPYPPLMDDIFGPAISDAERRARTGHVFIHAQMCLAQAWQGDDVMKAVFRHLYAAAKR